MPDEAPQLDAAARARPGPPLVAWAPFAGKTLLERLGPKQAELRRTPDWEGPAPDLIVFPYPHSAVAARAEAALRELAERMDQPLREAVAQGRTRLVFDASAEGEEHLKPFTKAVHRGLAWLGAPPLSAMLITQERNWGADYAAYCRAKGFSEQLRVAVYDFWIKRFHQLFEPHGAERLAERLAAFRARPGRRSRRFVSLNLTARKTKLLFLLSLLRDGLWDQGHISFGGLETKPNAFDPPPPPGEIRAKPFELLLQGMSGFADMGRELAPLLPELQRRGPCLLGPVSRDPTSGRVAKTPLEPVLAEYDDAWFTVVTETEMRPRPSRITEKPFKPIVNLHPFVVFGNPGALALLRELGFRSFGEALDEAYDEEPDPRRRFDLAYAEVLRLCRMDEAELARLVERLEETLVFNAEWAMTRLPWVYRDQLDEALLAQLRTWPGGA